jgi:hypothetical protein
VRVRRIRLGDHIDTIASTFALARAFMFARCLAEAEEQAEESERMAAMLLHGSARLRVRIAGMRAQLLEERGQLQEAEARLESLVLMGALSLTSWGALQVRGGA